MLALESDELLARLFVNFNSRQSTIIFFSNVELKNVVVEYYSKYLNTPNEFKLNMDSIIVQSLLERNNNLHPFTRSNSHYLFANTHSYSGMLSNIDILKQIIGNHNTMVIFIKLQSKALPMLPKLDVNCFHLRE